LVAASGDPGKPTPPTVFITEIFDSAGAPRQRSIAGVNARRTRTSSNGFRLWFGVIRLPQFQSLSWTVTWSPSAATSSARVDGGKPWNSIAARSPLIAATRVACLSAKMPVKPSR
jgi:hypothetical protein